MYDEVRGGHMEVMVEDPRGRKLGFARRHPGRFAFAFVWWAFVIVMFGPVFLIGGLRQQVPIFVVLGAAVCAVAVGVGVHWLRNRVTKT